MIKEDEVVIVAKSNDPKDWRVSVLVDEIILPFRLVGQAIQCTGPLAVLGGRGYPVSREKFREARQRAVQKFTELFRLRGYAIRDRKAG